MTASIPLRLCALLLLLAACSDDAKPCTGASCKEEEVDPVGAKDSGGPKLPVDVPDYIFEAGVAVPVTDPKAPLSVQLQVNGATTTCGACSVLIAQAQGGRQPYTYTWSDPTLSGAGPHRVCPTAPTSYSVHVVDSSEQMLEGSNIPAQTADAKGDVMCKPAEADGGITSGCTTMTSMGTPMAPGGDLDAAVMVNPDAGQVQCDPGMIGFDLTTGAVGTVTVSTRLEQAAFRKGQRYEYIVDRLVPFTLSLGQAIDVELWGGNSHCELAEKFVGYKLDFLTWHQSTCFTPTQDFLYLLVVVKLNGAIFNWELLTSSTTCTGCSTD